MKNKKSILKAQQSLKIGRHNNYTEELNRIILRSTNGKVMQSIDSM